jgi:protein TonB
MNATVFPAHQPSKGWLLSRNASIALAVVVLHVGFIWALQSGLLMRAVEVIVPAEVLAQFIQPSAPKVTPKTPKTPITPITPMPLTPPKPVTRAEAKAPAPQPLAIAELTPLSNTSNAPTGVTTAQPVHIAAAVAVAPVAPPAQPAIQLPSSDASYLQNPTPPYPALSRRLNEQGKTTVRVMIGIDGLPQRAEIAKSSGFDRLDQAAMATVMRWRYVPGKRGGTAEAMWFNVPINWVLE